MKNEKGFLFLSPIFAIGAMQMAFLTIAAVCIWHIPAWEKAKDKHCEVAYQAGDMNCGYEK